MRELKIKLYLEILILLWIKWPGMVEIKQKIMDVFSQTQDIQGLQEYENC